MEPKKKTIKSIDSESRTLNNDIEKLVRNLKGSERTASELGFYMVEHFIGIAVVAIEDRNQIRNGRVH